MGEEGDDGVVGLVFQGVTTGNSHLAEYGHGIVLDGANSRHLCTSLQRHCEEKPSERRFVPVELEVGFCGVFVLVCDGVLDLIELGENPWIIFVAVSVKVSQGLEALFGKTVINLPARRFGKEHDKEG